jgi:hypothetical protein
MNQKINFSLVCLFEGIESQLVVSKSDRKTRQ